MKINRTAGHGFWEQFTLALILTIWQWFYILKNIGVPKSFERVNTVVDL